MILRPPLETLFKRKEIRQWGDIAVFFGDSFCDLDGAVIKRGDAIKTKPGRLPALLDNRRTVVGDLIPSTSWGASLANMLTKASWQKLREPLIEANNKICELCGISDVRIDVHEIWSYEFPKPEEMAKRSELTVFGRQSLEGLMTVCAQCHECFHLGRANVEGRLDSALRRIRFLNNWDSDEITRYYKVVGQRWEEASEIFWMLDFSKIQHPDGGLTIASPWACHGEEPRLITAPNKYGGDNLTAILGAKWKFAKEGNWRPEIQPDAFEN